MTDGCVKFQIEKKVEMCLFDVIFISVVRSIDAVGQNMSSFIRGRCRPISTVCNILRQFIVFV